MKTTQAQYTICKTIKTPEREAKHLLTTNYLQEGVGKYIIDSFKTNIFYIPTIEQNICTLIYNLIKNIGYTRTWKRYLGGVFK